MRPCFLRAIVVAAASVWGTPILAAADDVAATVNGESITVRELDTALDADLRGAPLTGAQRMQLRVALLDDLIDERLLRQHLDKHGPKIDPAEIDAQMTALRQQLTRENRKLADYLAARGQTEAQLRASWQTQLQLLHLIKQQATDARLKEYHEAHRDHFDRVEVRASHIVIRTGAEAAAVDRAEARERLAAIRAEILANKLTFAAAARKYSQCTTARSGGDLGYILRRGLPENEPLARAAFAARVGELSEVIESERGLHLVLVTERKAGTQSKLEKEVLLEVIESFAEDCRAELVRKLRREGQIKVAKQ